IFREIKASYNSLNTAFKAQGRAKYEAEDIGTTWEGEAIEMYNWGGDDSWMTIISPEEGRTEK
ncbi:12653_t:CDS:2, partial [Acaulospora colombiana]